MTQSCANIELHFRSNSTIGVEFTVQTCKRQLQLCSIDDVTSNQQIMKICVKSTPSSLPSPVVSSSLFSKAIGPAGDSDIELGLQSTPAYGHTTVAILVFISSHLTNYRFTNSVYGEWLRIAETAVCNINRGSLQFETIRQATI